MRGTLCPAFSGPESGIGLVRAIKKGFDWTMHICPTMKTAGRRSKGLVRVVEVVGRMLDTSTALGKLDKAKHWNVKSGEAERREVEI